MLQLALRWAAGLFIGAWMGRYLGPAFFGQYASLLAFVLMISAISTLGLQSIVIRELMGHSEKGHVFTTAFLLRLGGGAIGILGALGWALWQNIPLQLLGWLLPILLLQSGDLWHYGFQAKHQAHRSAWSAIFGLVLTSVAQIGAIQFQQPLWVFLLIASGEYFFIVVFHGLQSLRFSFPWGRYRPEIARSLLKESWPIILSSAAMLTHYRLDLWLLESLSTSTETGYYAASSRIAQLYLAIPPLLLSTIYPMMVEFHKYSPKLYGYRLQDALRHFQFTALIPTLVLALWPQFWIELIFGEKYSEAAPSLFWLAFTLWPTAAITFMDRMAFVVKKPFSNLTNHLYSLLINIGLSFWWIPLWGAKGAALSTAVSLLLALPLVLFSDSLYRPHLKNMLLGFLLPLGFNEKGLSHPFFIFSRNFRSGTFPQDKG